jgi:hypothetical protein
MIEVTQKYFDNVFLLREGSLEDYIENILGTRPDFGKIVQFCNNSLNSWLSTDYRNPMVKELDLIYYCVTNS